MNAIRKFGPWTIRIFVSFVFLLSAVAKLYPKPSYALTYFEVHQLEPMGISLEIAAYLSRILIGIEFAIGILLLLPFFLKKIVIPATILMLGVFVLELTYEIFASGNKGNCGCFGTLIEMTPLEALIKNLVSIGLLVGFYFLNKSKESLSFDVNSRIQYSAILNVILGGVLSIFLIAPLQKQSLSSPTIPVQQSIEIDTVIQVNQDSTQKVKETKEKDTTTKIKIDQGPKQVSSGFETIFPTINKGKKVLCFFAPGCDHCRATAKSITELKKQMKGFPEVQIIFMDEEPELIPDFFKFAGAEYTYSVMDLIKFWKTIGKQNDVPGVMYLWNGNVQKFYQGIDKEQFSSTDFKKVLNKSGN